MTFVDNHHDDARLALWCASSSDVQQMLATSRPEQFFVPPYVAYLGWIGVRLDRDLAWDEIEAVIKDAHQVIADKMPRPRAAKAASAAKARRARST